MSAVERGEISEVRAMLAAVPARHPALARAVDRAGNALAVHAAHSANPEDARLFENAIEESWRWTTETIR